MTCTSRRSPVLCALATSFICAAGCSSEPRLEIVGEPTESRSDAITKGTADVTHQAVMLESCNKPCICTGTLVKKDDALGVGWILTAAHCIPPPDSDVDLRFYVQGNKAATFQATYVNRLEPGAIRYPILDMARHPEYESGGPVSADAKTAHDVGVIRILGVGKETPVMEIAGASDELEKGDTVVDVGYGSTGAWNDEDNLGAAGTRHSAQVKISSLSTTHISVSGKDSGGAVNIGDSGGPVIAIVGGVERVVGVHSAGVDNAFVSVRQSARVSGELGFVEGELAKIPKVDDCNTCLRIASGGVHSCAKTNLACLDDADCNAYALCVEGCANPQNVGPTKECRDQCKTGHPPGATLYEPAFACGCHACAALCGTVCPTEYLRPADPPPAAGVDAGNSPDDTSSDRLNDRPRAEPTGCVTSPRPAHSRFATSMAVVWALAVYRRRQRRWAGC